jgi:PKD repeat protein
MNYLISVRRIYKVLVFLTGLSFILPAASNNVFAQFPSASFTSNVVTGCGPLSVDFTNLSTQANSYQWDFGNGNSSTLTDPTTVYLTTGFYTVTLIATNTFTGNSDTLTATNYIEVVINPSAAFSALPLTGCEASNVINFSNSSVNANSYIWDFGDGNFSTLSNPVHTYANAGTYTVKLIAKNSYNCTDIMTQSSYITIYPVQQAAFTATPQSSCDASQVFDFTCTTTGVISWQWDFGDGTVSSAENPSHVYGTIGTFTVSLIVTTSNGCADTLNSPGFINIGPTLVPSFTASPQAGCSPLNVSFVCTVPNATSWQWDFGNGNTSTVGAPSTTYQAAGTYDVTLSVTTTGGCNGTVTLPSFITVDPDPVASFTVLNPTGCAPQTVSFTNTSQNGLTYTWDFGDGSTSTDNDPVHVYAASGTYDITLTAVSPNGCVNTTVLTSGVTVNTAVGSFSCTPRTGCSPLPVAYTGTAIPTGGTYQWFFGDGNTGTGNTGTHTYTAIGDYTVTMIVTTPQGCIDTVIKNNYVHVVPDTTPYTVPDTITVCLPPGTINVTDPTIGSNSWLWDFGDGSTSTQQDPSHTYAAPGNYTVTLTTGMAGGCTQVFNPYAYVNVIPFVVSPITSVTATPCGPFTVQLDNATIDVASYLWDFGDGTTSTLQNPVHTYTQQGTYVISLLLTGLNGCQASLSTMVTFGHPNPIVVSDDDICLGDNIDFSLSPAADFTSAVWDFGDGSTSTLLQPSHVYNASGTYVVSVTITDTDGCVFTYQYVTPVLISDPQPSFTVVQPVTGCIPFIVQFNNTSTGASSYSWNFGNGNTSLLANPSATYATAGVYSVTLNATENGCTRSVTLPNIITANQATVNFSFTPASGCLPLSVSFTDLSPAAVSWLWDFGDGTTSTQQNPVHVYTTIPTTNILLTIVDVNGCTRGRYRTRPTIVVPDIAVSDSVGCRPLNVNFTTTTVAASYFWDFGDGSTSVLQNPSHLYIQSGSFTVTLTCTLASGCTTSTVKPGLINVTSPVSDFTSPNLVVCAPSLVNFVNQSTGAVSWIWDFGDGITSTSENPSHIYNIPGTYTVSLISTAANGCTDTLIRVDYITVPGTFTNFSFTTAGNCVSTTATFSDSSINATSWFWNFGDGFTSTLQNPVHTYTDTGSYTVTLITTDLIGCSSFFSNPNPVVINPDPFVSATMSNNQGCVPLTVSFTNTSSGAVSYSWDFGDGTTSAIANPVHIYTTAGNYQPQLIATNTFGCIDTLVFPVQVIASAYPITQFLSSSASGCAPSQVSFTNQSGALSSPAYQWNFGNSVTSTLQDPSVTYSLPGVYTVQLIVTNAGGCSDTITQNVNVYAAPVINVDMSDSVSCGPMNVTFTNNSTNAVSFLWQFGDGDSSAATSPVHLYATAGSYTVTLAVTSSQGCIANYTFPNQVIINATPAASYQSNVTSGCAPVIVNFTGTSTNTVNASYSWNFGNGITGSSANIQHQFSTAGSYPVTLTVTNSNGCSDSVIHNITVNAVPVANATLSDSISCGPLTTSFINNSSGASGYSWAFGDGTSSSAVSPSHLYSNPGTYYITLVATSAGCIDTFNLPTPITIYTVPVASMNTSAMSGCSPFNVTFTSTSTQLNNAAYQWNCGNGQTGAGVSISSTYNNGGAYPVSLVVTNEGGCTDTASATINVTSTPVAAAALSDSSGCAPLPVTFINNSLNAAGYSWDFGDGNTSSQQNPVHVYNVPGNYTVLLIATNGTNCSDTLVAGTVHVKATPAASFVPSVISGCTPLNVAFTNTSSNLVNPLFQWNFGNGATSALQNPVVSFTQQGNFNVSLVVTNDEGCSDSALTTINTNVSPVAQGTLSGVMGCAPYALQFNSTSVNATSLTWNFGDGATDTIANGQHIYATAGTYYPFLVVSANGGCSDTLFFASPVTVNPSPVASFSVNQSALCSGETFQFQNLSSPATGLSSLWSIAGNTYTATNPVASFTAPGLYNVNLVVTNQYMCSDSVAQPNYIQVYDTLPPPVSPIVSVSVLNNTSVEVQWLNSAALDLGAYVLYRLNTVTGLFEEIYRDNSPNNSSMNVTSVFTDTGLNTLQKVYTYKLATLDRCAYTLPLSALTAHTTINVTAVPQNSDIRVSWTAYAGCSVSSYEINRVNLATGISQLIATVPPATLNYVDAGFVCPDLYSYRIKATSLCGNIYTSLSDTSVAQPTNTLANQKVEITRSTVIDDKDVLTEWLPPLVAPNRVANYQLLRSSNNINFTEIAMLPAGQLSYIDYDAYVHEQNYYYKVVVISDCQVAGGISNEGSSILLKSEPLNEQAKLWWTNYLYWNTGVDYYVIEKLKNGSWTPVKTVDGNITDTVVDE